MNATKEIAADPGELPATFDRLPEGVPFHVSSATFEKMVEAEVCGDDRVGPWDGQIYDKMPREHVHHMLATIVMDALMPRLPAGWINWGENLIDLGPDHLPLIDRTVFRGQPDDYRDHWPRPAEIGLIVGYSHGSLRYDLGAQLASYAGAGIPAYCRLDLAGNLVHAHEDPILAERRYDSMRTYPIGLLVPFRLDDVLVAEIPAKELLPVRRGVVGNQPPGDET